VIELGWWEESSIPSFSPEHLFAPALKAYRSEESIFTNDEEKEEMDQLRIICCPAQHNSGRILFRRNKTLWATWLIRYRMPNGQTFQCFFGG